MLLLMQLHWYVFDITDTFLTTTCAATAAEKQLFMKPPVKKLHILMMLGCLYAYGLMGQAGLTLYHMPHVTQAHQLNPAHNLYAKGYLALPFLSGGNFGLGNSAFSLGDMGISSSSFDFDDRLSYDDLLSQTGLNEHLFGVAQFDWLYIGFNIGKNYWSLGMSESIAMNSQYGPGFLELFADADAGRFIEGKTYDLSNFALRALHYRIFSVGYSRTIRKGLTIGGRFKYLWGYESFWTENRDFIVTGRGEQDLFDLSGELRVLGSGISNFGDEENDLLAYFFNPRNQGFAVDLGFHWRVNDQLELSASIIDLGRIHWENATNQLTLADTIQNPFDEVESVFDYFSESTDTQPTNFDTPLPGSAYIGLSYFLKPQTSLGFVLNPRWWADDFSLALALSFNTRLRRWLGLSASYVYLRESPANLGGGLSINLGALQLFAISDNLFGFFTDTRYLHLRGGINYTFSRQARDPYLNEPIASDDDPIEPPFLDPEPTDPVVVTPSPMPEELSPYFALRGSLRSREDGTPLDQFNMDIYEVQADGSRQLVRTGRFPESDFEVKLKRENTYILEIARSQYQQEQFEVAANVAQYKEPLLLFVKKEEKGEEGKEVTEGEEVTKGEEVTEGEEVTKGEEVTEGEEVTKGEEVKEEEVAEVEKGKPYNPTTLQPTTPPSLQPYNPTTDLEETTPEAYTSPSDDREMEELPTFAITQRTSLRASDTHESKVLDRLAVGTEVELLEKTRPKWWKVQVGRQTGWVKARLLVSLEHRS